MITGNAPINKIDDIIIVIGSKLMPTGISLQLLISKRIWSLI